MLNGEQNGIRLYCIKTVDFADFERKLTNSKLDLGKCLFGMEVGSLGSIPR